MLILSKNFQFPEKCEPVTAFVAANAATIGATAAVAGTAASIQQGRQAAKQQERASRAQQRLEEFRSTREKRKQVRQAAVLRAQIANQAVATGTAGSSGAIGGMAGIQGRAASNIFSMNMQEGFGRTISGSLEKAASAKSNAATASAIGNVGMTIFQGYNKPDVPGLSLQENVAAGGVDLSRPATPTVPDFTSPSYGLGVQLPRF